MGSKKKKLIKDCEKGSSWACEELLEITEKEEKIEVKKQAERVITMAVSTWALPGVFIRAPAEEYTKGVYLPKEKIPELEFLEKELEIKEELTIDDFEIMQCSANPSIDPERGIDQTICKCRTKKGEGIYYIDDLAFPEIIRKYGKNVQFIGSIGEFSTTERKLEI